MDGMAEGCMIDWSRDCCRVSPPRRSQQPPSTTRSVCLFLCVRPVLSLSVSDRLSACVSASVVVMVFTTLWRHCVFHHWEDSITFFVSCLNYCFIVLLTTLTVHSFCAAAYGRGVKGS
eukprot:GHVU01007841.1.p1 GENE.GHVU01007841.1~~GHVU01007841.1.p1  ORF type:complete len:118 (+),score=2.90 GHVU01007841.1:228-581(+)